MAETINLSIHPNARGNFEEQAVALLHRLYFGPVQLPKGTPADRVVAGSISKEDIIDITTSGMSHTGRATSISFHHNGNEVGFKDESYRQFEILCESVQRISTIKPFVSMQTVKVSFFRWIKEKYLGTTQASLIDFAISQWTQSLAEYEVWIPLGEMSVQCPFRVGRVTIQPFTEKFFKSIPSVDPIHLAAVEGGMERMRIRLQGRAASTIKLFAEEARAFEIALEETERSVGAIRFVARQMLRPDAFGTAAPMGIIDSPTDGHFILRDGVIAHQRTGIAEIAKDHWIISAKEIEQMFKDGLVILHELLISKNRASFENDLLDSLLVYTRAAATTNIADRLMYVFSAIESFLLQDNSESIQQNMSERIAFISVEDGSKRREMIKTYKDAYALRSKYVHHGQTIADGDKIRSFFIDIWTFYLTLLGRHKDFTTRQDMFNYIDKLKFG